MEVKAKTLLDKAKKKLEEIGHSDTDVLKADLKTILDEFRNYQEKLESEISELEETLVTSDKLYTSCLNLFESFPEAYIIIDSSHVIKNLNEAACNILGVMKEDVLDTEFTGLIHPEFNEAYNTCFKKLKKGSGYHSCEVKLLPGAGSSPVLVRINGVQQHLKEDKEPEYHLIVTDISQQKETEEKLQEESQKLTDSEKL